jgi:hypothetical protein
MEKCKELPGRAALFLLQAQKEAYDMSSHRIQEKRSCCFKGSLCEPCVSLKRAVRAQRPLLPLLAAG